MSGSFLQFDESPDTPPDGTRKTFSFLPPSGHVPVDGGNTLWLIGAVKQESYSVAYESDKITVTMGEDTLAPEVTDLFQFFADAIIAGSDSVSDDFPVENFTDYTPADFRATYPQVSNYPGITDGVLNSRIVQGSIYVNKGKWGKYYYTGMGLITAHIVSLQIDAGLFTKAGGISSGGISGSFSLGPSGAINSASAGSVSYSASIDNSKGGQIDEWLKATGWGQMFLTMRSMITAPSATVSKLNGFGISGF